MSSATTEATDPETNTKRKAEKSLTTIKDMKKTRAKED